MPNLKRNFIRGRMNKSLDERLVPQGEYVDAMNVRLGSTENSEIGSVENTKGNTPLTDIEINGQKLSTSAKCIGAFEDGARETIYWFVHDPQFAAATSGKCDLILSYNTNTSLLTYHIISISKDATFTSTTLNFNSQYLITGVNLVDDMLFFTDDYNPPRKINITKSYPIPSPAGVGGIDAFIANDILVIKAPPIDCPIVTLTNSGDEDNYLKDKFICFAYRYKYEDGEYSATSPFSEIAFIANDFNISAVDYLNAGMTNLYNLAQVQIYTGDSLVKGFDLLFKEANSTIIRVIQQLDKVKEGIPDQAQWSFNFDNSKVYTVLPSSEILRLYDNVPRFAKAQTIMGNRLMYGNYVDGYNLKDENNNDIRFAFSTSLVATDVESTVIPPAQLTTGDGDDYTVDLSVAPQTITDCEALIDLTGMPLTKGTTLAIDITFEHSQFTGTAPTATTPSTTINFIFTLQQDFASVFDLASSTLFVNYVGTNSNIQLVSNACNGVTFTDRQNCVLPGTLATYSKVTSGVVIAGQPIQLSTSAGSNVIGFQLVAMAYVNTSPAANCYEYYKITSLQGSYRVVKNTSSLHSNRDYEIGMIYLDSFGRATTALVSPSNTTYVPCNNSILQNKLKVTIPTTQLPPSWAEHYRFVCKANKETYYNIYSNFFYQDTVAGFFWLVLEGDNSSKVEKGDKLRVKRDINGFVSGCVETVVLEKLVKAKGFIDDGGGTGPFVPPQAGVYIKLRPQGFSLATSTPVPIAGGQEVEITPGDYAQVSNNFPSASSSPLAPLAANTLITINIKFERFGSILAGVGICQEYCYELDQTYTTSQDYANFKEFWISQVDVDAGTQCGGSYTINNSMNYTSSAGAGSFPSGVEDENQYVFHSNTTTGTDTLYIVSGAKVCGSAIGMENRASRLDVRISISPSTQNVVFETIGGESQLDIYYEGSQTFRIKSDKHLSGTAPGDQDQTALLPAIVSLDFANCITFGNGVESYQIEDSVSGPTFELGNRVTSVAAQDYKEADRFADLTYSGVYNDESNVNKLNEFNLGLANFFPLEDSFGDIQILHGRETDILTLQEDKISYITVGKNILTDAVGGGTVTSVPQVLGQQVARLDEYGISNNPESFVVFGYDKFFTDSKRGAVLRLKGSAGSNEQLTVLSEVGMRSWFRDLFITSGDTQKLGGFDPYMNEYVLSSNDIKLPEVEECIECGIIQNAVVGLGTPYTFCVDLTTVTGTVNIPYTFAVGSQGTIEATYNAVTTSTGVVSGSGTLSFNKNSPAVTSASITITANVSDATLRLSVDCPITESLKVIQVCVTSNIDSAQFIHNEFGYTDGTYISPTNSNSVTFVAGTTNPLISQYDSFNGVQGDSVCPTNGSTVRLTSNKLGFDNFTFDTTNDKFRYLRSNTVYANNPVDIAALIAASTQALPLVTTGAPTAYYAEFTMPGGTDDILYLIYDYRNSVEYGLCYDAASIVDVCCACTHHWYLMRNSADSTEEYVAISPVALVVGTYHTLISKGTKCFEVISTSTTLPTEHINTTCTP
jgi:hypothetical protein